MQLNELGGSEVVALEQSTLPPRSRVYSLKPIGIGTPEVESLTVGGFSTLNLEDLLPIEPDLVITFSHVL
jgi:ABC-type Fe3+-hydroxamate transport system substrate-binding protein